MLNRAIESSTEARERIRAVKNRYLGYSETTIEKLLRDKLNSYCECKILQNQIAVFIFRMDKPEEEMRVLQDQAEKYLKELLGDRRNIMTLYVDRVFRTEEDLRLAEIDVQTSLDGADRYLKTVLAYLKTLIKPGVPAELYLDKGEFIVEVDPDYAIDESVVELREEVDNILSVNNWYVKTRFKRTEDK